MILPYQFFPRLFLRAPLWSYADYEAGSIEGPLKDPGFRLALYLASPGFYRVLESKNFNAGLMNEKELHSLEKYYNRMSFRPTPFGLFSSFTLAEWGEEDHIMLQEASGAILHLRADQQAASAAANLVTSDRLTMVYHLNPSLYRAGRDFRFVKTNAGETGTRLSYSLESFEANPLTRALCCFLKTGAKSGQEIIKFVSAKTGCEAVTAASYLAFLGEAQVIRSPAHMNITGEDYLLRVAGDPGVHFPGIKELAGEFNKTPGAISEISPGRLNKLEQQFKDFLSKDSHQRLPDKFFYANTERRVLNGSVRQGHQAQLMTAVSVLSKLSRLSEPELLQQFAINFNKRFENRKIPLLLALDPDTGVDYGNFAQQTTVPALLKDLQFPGENNISPTIAWSPVHRMLLEKWNGSAVKDGIIRLESKDVEFLKVPSPDLLPSGIAVMFRPTYAGLFIENAAGVTGTSLIGRFTPFSNEIHAFAGKIAATESGANPGVVFAEIGQLSDEYIDNINRRLYVYDYEIPVNSVSLLPESHQIRLDDLLVSVRNREVILESARLKSRVIPRLSSAYNFRHNNLAIFRFLCDLQYQSIHANLTLDLESYFPGMSHYPRVEYEGIILSAAKWHIGKDQRIPATTGQLRNELQLPPQIALTRFDQQLVFDLDNERQAGLFAECIRGEGKFTLQEFLLPAENQSAVSAENGKPLINQYVAFMANQQPVYRGTVFSPPPVGKVKREFIPGSQWLYLKIYCTQALADDLLVRKILPVVTKVLKQDGTSWFFIRYTDPGAHIRLRVKITEKRSGELIGFFKAQFSDLVSGQLVREYQADTYRRELERYGPDLIEAVEQVFRASSDLVVHFIKNNKSAKYTTDHFAISSFALMLDTMIRSTEKQEQFLKSVCNAFYIEYRGNKAFRIELDKLYRGLKQEFVVAILDQHFYTDLGIRHERDQMVRAIDALRRENALADEERKHNLLADMIHMHINRSYRDRQRQQEMVLYYCFYKYKLSQQAKSAKSTAGTSSALEQPFFHGI